MNETEKTKQQPPGKKRTRLFLRLLLYPLVVLIILLLGAFLFLQTETARHTVKAFIEKAAVQYLQADLMIGKITGSLLFDISLEEVRISRRDDSILTAKKVSASYLLPLLLTRILMLSEVEVDGMVLNLIRETDGRLNIAAMLPAGKAPETPASRLLSLTTLVSRIAIFDSMVLFTDRQTAGAPVHRISDIRLEAGLKLSPRGVVSARLIKLALDLDKSAFRLANLSGRMDYTPERNRLDIEDIRIRLKETDVTVSGSLDLDPADIQFSIRAAMKSLSLPEIGQIFLIPELDRGRLAGTLQVRGKPDSFYHEAHLRMDEMSLLSRGQIDRTVSGSLDADIFAAVRNLNPAALPLAALNRISGDFNSDIRLQGTDLSRPGRRGLLSMDLKPSRISGYNLSAARIDAAFDAGGIVFKDSFLAGPQGRMNIHHAVVDIFNPDRIGRLSLDASLLDLDPVLSGYPELSGKVNLNVKAAAVLPVPAENRFDPAAITAEISADIGPSELQSVEIGEGRIQAVWNGRDIAIQALELSGAVGRLTISGLLTPGASDSNLQFKADLPDLGSVAALVLKLFPDRFASVERSDLEGRLTISGKLTGWWDRPDLSAVVDGSSVRYDKLFAENFNVRGTFSGLPGAFRSNARVHAENVTVSKTRLPIVDLALRLSPDNVTADITLQYEKELALRAIGRMDGWRRPIKKITIDTLRLTPADKHRNSSPGPIEEITNSGPIRLTLATGAFEVAALKLVSKEAELFLAGRLSDDSRIQGTLSLNHLDLNRLPRFIENQDKFSGMFSADMELSGTLTQPVLNASLQVKDASGFDFSFSELDVSLNYNAARVTFRSAGYRRQTKILDLSGEVGVLCSLQPFIYQLQSGGFKVAVITQDLKLSALPIPKKEGLNYDGLLSLNLDIAGELGAPSIKGQVTLQDGFLAPENKDPRDYTFSELKIDFRYKAAIADISAALYRQKQKLLDLSGQAALELSLVPFHFKPLDDGFRLDAAARDLKLSMLPIPRQAGIDFDALLNFAASATGSLSQPIINGSLSLQDGFLTLLNPALSYETVRAQIDFSPDGIVINELLLKGDTEGLLNLKGHINLEGLRPTAFRMRLTGENVFIPYEKAVTARIRPDLILTGTPQKPFLAGTLTVTEGRVNLDQLSARRPAEIQVVATGSEKRTTIDIVEDPGTAQKLLLPLAADILVAIPKNAWLKGQGVNTEMAGEINLKKEAGKPFILVGSLNTVRGTFDFQSKLFKITRGNVDFIGMEELNPNLDIQAEIRIARVTIIVKLSGTAERMILDLDSDPSMDRSDIISYLVYGKPASQLNNQQFFNAEQAALNLTGTLAVKELKSLLGNLVELDVLTIESGGGDISQGALAVGKYITPEVFVLYRYRFKVDEPDLLEVTYEINRNFSIETQLGDEKTTGIDFIWNFDF